MCPMMSPKKEESSRAPYGVTNFHATDGRLKLRIERISVINLLRLAQKFRNWNGYHPLLYGKFQKIFVPVYLIGIFFYELPLLSLPYFLSSLMNITDRNH